MDATTFFLQVFFCIQFEYFHQMMMMMKKNKLSHTEPVMMMMIHTRRKHTAGIFFVSLFPLYRKKIFNVNKLKKIYKLFE